MVTAEHEPSYSLNVSHPQFYMRLQYVTHRSCGGMIVAIQNVFASVDFQKFTTAIQLEQERVYICRFFISSQQQYN